MAVIVTSRGNKGTENIDIRLKTISNIENYEVFPEDLVVNHNDNLLTIKVARLNPSQEIKVFVRCKGQPRKNQIDELYISHSEGSAINEKEIQKISINIFGIELEYNIGNLKTKISRIGPFIFR